MTRKSKRKLCGALLDCSAAALDRVRAWRSPVAGTPTLPFLPGCASLPPAGGLLKLTVNAAGTAADRPGR
jgi:hypothetical protein